MVPRCPTRVGQTFKLLLRRDKVGDDGEASENPEDWGVCHSDCPLRAYRDNQVRVIIALLSWAIFHFWVTTDRNYWPT